MFSWGQDQKPEYHHLLVLDIGTSVVKALVIYIEENEVNVVNRGYAAQSHGSMRGGMITDFTSVVDVCRQAISKATEGMDHPPTDLILGVNGQMVEGVTTTLHYDRTHPQHPLEQSELKNIIYTIQRRSQEKLRENLQEKFMDSHPDIELMHASIVELQLDGYPVENPIGFQGKRLSLTVFNAYIPLVYSSVMQSLARALDLDLISIATQPYGLSKLMVNSPTQEEMNAIIIDIGGTSTDVVIIKNGSVEAMHNFAIGGRAFTRGIKNSLKLAGSVAEKTKRAYANNELDKRKSAKVQAAIESPLALWKSGIHLALQDMPDTKMLPSQIFLTGGGALLPDLSDTLRTKWPKQISFVKRPQIKVIDSDEVGLVADIPGLDWGPQDLPPLGVAKLTLNLVNPKDTASATLQGIVRSMRQNK